MKPVIIDIHTHVYRMRAAWCSFCHPDELLALYDRAGIVMGALLPIVSPEIYQPQANEDILEIAAAHPDRFFPFCNIDPRHMTNSADAPLDRLIRHYKDRGCKGIGEIMPNMPMRHPMVQNLFRCAEKVGGMPVTWDGSDWETEDFGLQDDPGMPQLEHSLQRFEKLDFIAHGPCFWAEIGRLERPAQRKTVFRVYEDGKILQLGYYPPQGKITEEGAVAQLLRKYGNLYAELSDAHKSLIRDEDYTVRFLTEFQDRLMFGTDTCSPTHEYASLNLLNDLFARKKIKETVYRKIIGLNAIKYFNLDEALAKPVVPPKAVCK